MGIPTAIFVLLCQSQQNLPTLSRSSIFTKTNSEGSKTQEGFGLNLSFKEIQDFKNVKIKIMTDPERLKGMSKKVARHSRKEKSEKRKVIFSLVGSRHGQERLHK